MHIRQNSSVDYYPFGMLMKERSFSSEAYHWGFNGQEKDDEISGSGNVYDYGFRIYNPMLGKFFSIDPLTKSFPYYTPYQYAGNKPIVAIDLDGLEDVWCHQILFSDGTKISISIVSTDDGFEDFKKQMCSLMNIDPSSIPQIGVVYTQSQQNGFEEQENIRFYYSPIEAVGKPEKSMHQKFEEFGKGLDEYHNSINGPQGFIKFADDSKNCGNWVKALALVVTPIYGPQVGGAIYKLGGILDDISSTVQAMNSLSKGNSKNGIIDITNVVVGIFKDNLLKKKFGVEEDNGSIIVKALTDKGIDSASDSIKDDKPKESGE